MEIKLPNGTGVVTNNHDCIEMYKKMGGIEVEEKPKKGRPPKAPTKDE